MVRVLATLAAAIVIATRLTVVGDAEAAVDRTLTDSVVVLEQAVNALAKPSSDHMKILRGVVSSWPTGGAAFVPADLRAFLARAPGAGSDFKCSADFLRDRARRELLRLRDVLLDANPQPPSPRFCNTAPVAIDPAQNQTDVEIYGYDFDREPVVQVLLMDGFGFKDVTFAVVRRTHYHLTLHLDGNGLRFSAANQRLALTVGHLIQAAIPIVQEDTPLCDSRIETTPPGKMLEYAPPLLDFRERLTGAGSSVLANVALDYEANQVSATFCMTVAENTASRRASSGCAADLVYSADPERVIEGVLGRLEDQIADTQSGKAGAEQRRTATGPVDRWQFTRVVAPGRSDQEARIAIRLRGLRLVSTRIDRCISPIAYVEARRLNSLSKATIQRLDRQLRKIAPAILSMRPRFAPLPASR